MKKHFCLTIILAFVTLFFGCGGGGGSTPSSVTVTLSPVDGATYKLLGTAVTATFSAAITAPSDWSNIFTLKKDGAGDNLCTSVTLSEDALTATCVHDELDFASSYTVALTGLSGATDPTPATFQTSNLFAGFNASNGYLVRVAIDQPSVGQVTVWAPDYWPERVANYTIDPADPTLYTIIDAETQARVSGNFADIMTGASGVAFCLLIDPNQTDMNFRLGTNYGGMSLESDRILYYTDNSSMDGTEVFPYSENISLPPANLVTMRISAYTFSPTNYYFTQTSGINDISSYINADGYYIAMVKEDGNYWNLIVSSEDLADGTIPADVSVGDVYNGYLYIISDTVKTLQLTVTAIDATSVTFSYIFDSTDEGSLSFTNVTDPAAWGTGFYKTNEDEVIRFLGPNAILFTLNNLSDDFNFGVLVK